MASVFSIRRPEITAEGAIPHQSDGARKINARIAFFYPYTGITPAMCMRLPGIGSQYLIATKDGNGEYLDGDHSYRLTLPPGIPQSRFWSVMVYDRQTRSMLQTGQTKPDVGSQSGQVVPSPDGSTEILFGASAPEGKVSNWLQTVPGKGFFVILRLYNPMPSFFDKTWRPSEIEPISSQVSESTQGRRRLDRLHHPVLIDRVVYSTITMMSVLIIYDGWQHLRLVDVIAVIIGPVLAMFLAHVFSAAIAQHVEVARILRGREWLGIARIQAPFLLLCVPPIAIVSILFAFGVSLTDSIRVTLWVGVASLGFWGFLAGRRAGFAGWRMVAVVVAGLLIGIVVLLIQVFLQPGKAFSGGVALG